MKTLDVMFTNIDKISDELDIDKKYVQLLKKYKPIIFIFEQFTNDVIENKNTIFPNQQIKEELIKLNIL